MQANDQVRRKRIGPVTVRRVIATRHEHTVQGRSLRLKELVPLLGPFKIYDDEEVHVGRAPTKVVLCKLLGRTAEKFVQVLDVLALGVFVATVTEVARRDVVLEHRYADKHA